MSKILRHELIGLSVTIVNATNKQLVGLIGIIIDETKNTFVIAGDGKKPKRVMKKDITLKIGKYVIKGALLLGRPEDRVKT